MHKNHQPIDAGDAFGIRILGGSFGDDDIHLRAGDDAVAGAGLEGCPAHGFGRGAGGLAGGFRKGQTLAALDNAYIYALANLGDAVDKNDQAVNLRDAFSFGILGGGFADDHVEFGAGNYPGGRVARSRRKGRGGGLGRHFHFGEHLHQNGFIHAFADAREIHHCGLSATTVGDERNASAEAGDARGAVLAFIADEDFVAIAHLRHNESSGVRGVNDIAGVDGRAGGCAVGVDHGNNARVARAHEEDGQQHQQYADDGQEDERKDAPFTFRGVMGGRCRLIRHGSFLPFLNLVGSSVGIQPLLCKQRTRGPAFFGT